MRFFRFLLTVAVVVIALDYVRDNVPGFPSLKLPLPPLPLDAAKMIAHETEKLQAQASKLLKTVEAQIPQPQLPNMPNRPPLPDIARETKNIENAAKDLRKVFGQ